MGSHPPPGAAAPVARRVTDDATSRPLMGSPEREHPATAALRAASLDDLRASLIADLRKDADFRDWRDVLLHLAPYFDAAARLGTTPRALFDDAAAQVPDAIADVARTFGRRADVTLAAFGWRLDDGGREAGDGPAYRFAWPRWDPPSPTTRREGPQPRLVRRRGGDDIRRP